LPNTPLTLANCDDWFLLTTHSATLVTLQATPYPPTFKARELLPTSVTPSHYDLWLNPDLLEFTFDGKVDITVAVSDNVSSITMHANQVQISTAVFAYTGADDATAIELTSTAVTYEAKKEEATITFASSIPAGTSGVLTLEFEGILNDEMAGFYRSKYTSKSGEEKYMATTQFEATDARRAFPCWDEPAKKATFTLTMVVPGGMQVLSNMPVVEDMSIDEPPTETSGRVVTFDKTPIMSTYLLAFVIGEFEPIRKTTKTGVEVAVWTPPGLTAEGEFPLDVAVQTLEYFTEFFDIPYPLSGARFSTETYTRGCIDSHACSLEASWRVTNGVPLGCSLLLPVGTVHSVQTLKAQA
jgi:aminopeptidase N